MSNGFFDFDLFAAPEPAAHLSAIKGEGRSHILVLYTTEDAPAADEQYLAAILKPQPLAFDLQKDVFFLALQKNEPISAVSIIRQHRPKYVLLFGCRPEDCGIRLQLSDYAPVTFQGIVFLKADSLQQIRTDRENNDNRRAGALWNALKEIF